MPLESHKQFRQRNNRENSGSLSDQHEVMQSDSKWKKENADNPCRKLKPEGPLPTFSSPAAGSCVRLVAGLVVVDRSIFPRGASHT
jgi:hypothetical protein